jgi:tetratricopeptide (TPR) repeat protein
VKRDELLTVMEAALTIERRPYARDVALALMEAWPNDLAALFGLARALAPDDPVEAINRLRQVVEADGQDAEAQALLGRLLADQGRLEEADVALASALVIRPDDAKLRDALRQPPAWLSPALRAHRALEVGDAQSAFRVLQALTEARGDEDVVAHPAPWLVLLEAAWRAARWTELRAIATRVRSRWSGAVLPGLLLGAVLMHDGQHEPGAVLLHDAAAQDPTGRVAIRLWGPGHPYRHLWPQPPSVELPGPLPVEISAVLGRNRLPGGALSATEDAVAFPEATREVSPTPLLSREPEGDVRPRLRILAAQPPHKGAEADAPSSAVTGPGQATRVRAPSERPSEPASSPSSSSLSDEGRIAIESLQSGLADLAARATGAKHPSLVEPPIAVHVILSHYGKLEARYGAAAAAHFAELLQQLAKVTEADTGIMTDLIYVDQADSLGSYELSPVVRPTPDTIKALLASVDDKLAAEKARAAIASVLIVGDDGVIPFYRLPNPVEDNDPEILTDAPYATRGRDALVGERAVGRLPQADLEGLTQTIQSAIDAHRRTRPGLLARLRAWLRRILRLAPRGWTPSLGYAASVWRNAAREVYAVIGASDEMHTSPPVTAANWRPDGLGPARYGYFNLHGLEDVPSWYGQRDPSLEPIYPDFPIALSPDDVVNGGRAPRAIFTEACYGANVVGKSAREALALRFMECGTVGYVGSTGIAYGSVSLPLSGADLLARRFWERLSAGYSQGRALRDAKIAFAREMDRRQGYLDTEDQKTLVGFVLYGDPTICPEHVKSEPKGRSRRVGLVELPALTLAGSSEPAPADTVSNEVIQQVKGLIAPFLPGVHEARVTLAVPKVAPPPLHAKGRARPSPNVILTLRKDHRLSGEYPWQQVARITLTDTGRVVKVVVSR